MSQLQNEDPQVPLNDTSADTVPKICGADVELGNFIMGLDQPNGTCFQASRALLREIRGISDTGVWSSRPIGTYAGNRYEPSSASTPGAVYQDYGYNSGQYNQGYGAQSSYGYNPQDWGRKFLPANGGCVQALSSPMGTTSRWALNASSGPSSFPQAATRLGLAGSGA